MLEAIQLLETCELRDLIVSDAGLVRGELRSKKIISVLQVQFDSSGTFVPDPSAELVKSLVFVFLFLRGLEQNHSHQDMPTWLSDRFRLTLPVQDESGGIIPQLKIENLEQLQAYWALVDLATQKKSLLPAEELAKYTLRRFPREKWKVQRAALEALLERLNSAKREKLKIANSPGNVRGHFRVFRKTSKKPLPYEIVVYNAIQLSGSCTCKDFQKSSLGLCKHLAAAFFKPPRKTSAIQAHVSWRPPTSFGSTRDFVNEISLETFQGKVSERLAPFFETRKNPAPLKLSSSEVSPAQKLKTFEKLEAALKASQSKTLIDSAVFPQLRDETRRVQWQSECEKLWPRFQSEISSLNVKLFPYQKEGVRRALLAGRFIIADEMGLGKTVQGIAWAEALLRSGTVKRVLVVCPNALKFQWQREWLKTSGRQISIVEGNPEDRQKIYESRDNVLVINYELLLRDLPAIEKLSPPAMILDEAQRIKNYMTKTSQYVKSLEPKFRLILTGTPMENRLQELTSLVDWIDSRAMPPVWSLDARLSIDGDGNGHGAKGVGGIDVLRKGLSPHLLRRRRSEVLTQLPKRTDSPLYIPVTEEQRAAHDEISKKVARLAAFAERRPLTQEEHLQLMCLLNMMRMISNGMAHFNFEELWPSLEREKNPEKRLLSLFSPKLIEFRNLIEGLLSQNVKIVIFSQWQRMLRLAHWSVADLLSDSGLEAVFFTGRESARRRTENIVRFHDEARTRCFFATDAGGVGLNLQQAASVCINLEMPWNPAVLEQRNSRIYRLGQKQPVQIFNLITRETIEERIQGLVARKQAVFSAVFDGTSDEVRYEDGSGFYKQIQNVMSEFQNEVTDEDDSDVENDSQSDVEKKMLREQDHDSDELISLPPPHVQDAADIAKENSKNVDLNAANLQRAFAGMRVERGESGSLKIEAEGESAAILASIFKGMADMFSSNAT